MTPSQEPSRLPTTCCTCAWLPAEPPTAPPSLPLLLLLTLLLAPPPTAVVLLPVATAVLEAVGPGVGLLLGLSCSMLPRTEWSLAKVRDRESPLWRQLTSRLPARPVPVATAAHAQRLHSNQSRITQCAARCRTTQWLRQPLRQRPQACSSQSLAAELTGSLSKRVWRASPLHPGHFCKELPDLPVAGPFSDCVP